MGLGGSNNRISICTKIVKRCDMVIPDLQAPTDPGSVLAFAVEEVNCFLTLGDGREK